MCFQNYQKNYLLMFDYSGNSSINIIITTQWLIPWLTAFFYEILFILTLLLYIAISRKRSRSNSNK